MKFIFLLLALPCLITCASLSTRTPSSETAGPLKYEVLATEDSLKKDFCEHDYSYIKDKVCLKSNQQQLKIYIPDGFAKTIAAHVAALEAGKYFLKMDPADFFHGHFIVRGTRATYNSVEEYLSDVSAILYHTDEYTGRWFTKQRTLRSLIGQKDGKIIPAIKMMKEKTTVYKDRGTAYSADIVEAHPELSKLEYNMSEPAVVKIDTIIDGKSFNCAPKAQLHIRPQTDGRFQLQSGLRYEMLMYCELDQTVTN